LISVAGKSGSQCYRIWYESHEYKRNKHGSVAGINKNAFPLFIRYFANRSPRYKEHADHLRVTFDHCRLHADYTAKNA
jgi:hypothetical protein